MKTIGLMVVGAMFAFSATSAVAQTVQKTTKTQKHAMKKTTAAQTTSGATQRVGSSVNAGAEYATSPRGGISNYKEQADANQTGASAENGEETVTITPKDQGSQPNTPTTTKKTTSKKVVATTKKSGN